MRNPAIVTYVDTGGVPVYCRRGKLACIVVKELDLREGKGVVQGHENRWLDQNVDHVHSCMPKEEGRRVQPCSNRPHSHCTGSTAKWNTYTKSRCVCLKNAGCHLTGPPPHGLPMQETPYC